MDSDPVIPRALYGGAMEAELPTRFVDVSDFRPVPDHQEVWTDASEDQSLVLEIVEHDQSITDANAARHYWQDSLAGNQSASDSIPTVTALRPEDIPFLPPARLSYACLVSGMQAVSKGRQPQEAANMVSVQLAILRMPAVRSDILVTLNSPVVISEASQAAQHAGAGPKQRHIHAAALVRKILHSLTVMNWELFGA